MSGAPFHAVLARLGPALIIYAFSELIFVNEGPAAALLDLLATLDGAAALAMLEMSLWYLLMAAIFLAALRAFGPQGITGLMLAATICGWATEALLVPVVYEAPPFSFAWPSIGWHALVDIGIGWCALRLAMRRLAVLPLALVFVLAGIAWGGWSTWLNEGPDAALAVPPAQFPAYALAIGAIWMAGTWVSDRYQPGPAVTRFETILLMLVSLAFYVLTGLAHWPWALILAGLVAITFLALRHAPPQGRALLARLAERPPARAYGLMPIMPVAAIATYLWMEDTGRALPTEIVVLSLLALGTLAFLAALGAAAIAVLRK